VVRTLDQATVLATLKISARTLENWVQSGQFPPPVRVGKRCYWAEEAVERGINTPSRRSFHSIQRLAGRGSTPRQAGDGLSDACRGAPHPAWRARGERSVRRCRNGEALRCDRERGPARVLRELRPSQGG
jgi:predicted DNA-binding transcriptional regulator AlpA